MPISNATKQEIKKGFLQIQKSDRIFLTTHEGTDGDDLGSLLATRLALAAMGKQVMAAVSKGVPEYLKFLPGNEEVADRLERADFDLVITFGCSQLTRTGLAALAGYDGPVINVDHHPDNQRFGQYNIVEPATSSVAELMYYFFDICDVAITKDMATCILTGIFTDTGGFVHANTTSHALAVAAELMNKGARVDKISKRIVGQNNPAAHRIWARALENTRFNSALGMVYAVVTAEDLEAAQASDDDLSGFVNFLCTIPQAKFSMLLRQDGEVVRGSVRSEADRNVDVNKIAALFGGGGHKLASGFKLRGRLVAKGNTWQIV